MRKKQKQEILEYIRMFHQAHDQIRAFIEKKEDVQAMCLLEQCQQLALRAGTLIEDIEGEGFVTVKMLEDYCELTYQIHNKISQLQIPNFHKEYKNLHRQMIMIENSVKNDIKVRIEAVFLPYKASMWDSLESVWKAAEEDPDCDAYVIPIPYYDKNPDGSVKKMHYEGDMYPDYVPVTNYNDYIFEERRPDMIFIHNPYDEYNRVTSVHPFFYSVNLKKFTEKLVYIPYFVLNDVSADKQETVDYVAHFCRVPGVMNADSIIVQSEEMKRIYVDVLAKFIGKNTGNYWKNIIAGIGSPKVDKILDAGREEPDIPEDWKAIIQKRDGSRKKIVFYNTSVSTLLKNGNSMLGKMQRVFDLMKERQEETALLWRPHPLMQASIEAAFPELMEKYQNLVRKYKEEGWGIYDDSPDISRAVAVCDAYYGDASSVVSLCKSAGKMIMIQNLSVI